MEAISPAPGMSYQEISVSTQEIVCEQTCLDNFYETAGFEGDVYVAVGSNDFVLVTPGVVIPLRKDASSIKVEVRPIESGKLVWQNIVEVSRVLTPKTADGSWWKNPFVLIGFVFLVGMGFVPRIRARSKKLQ
jgi:hypothetical protein